VSDTQQGPGWWQASDGKWYPPETHPSRQVPPPAVPPPGYPGEPRGSSLPPAGAPPWGNPYSPYGYPAAVGPLAAPRQTNGLAIASLACSAAGIIPFFFGVSCVVGIVLGFVSLGQIKRTGGVQQGRGLAIAGIAVGFSLIAIFVLILILAVVGVHSTNVGPTTT
jgi:hypothetical protein